MIRLSVITLSGDLCTYFEVFFSYFSAASVDICTTSNQLCSLLRPLFFEVPKPPVSAQRIFVGRKWLFREILEHLSSDLPTSKGITILGCSATGKTSIILQLVQNSYFGQKGTLSKIAFEKKFLHLVD